jgi:hypothetical protein
VVAYRLLDAVPVRWQVCRMYVGGNQNALVVITKTK